MVRLYVSYQVYFNIAFVVCDHMLKILRNKYYKWSYKFCWNNISIQFSSYLFYSEVIKVLNQLL